MDEAPTKTSDGTSIGFTSDSTGKLITRQYVVELFPSDVLLGRGPGIDQYHGNVEFRKVVNQWKLAYQAATRGTDGKDEIVEMILAKIVTKSGRFLRRVTDSSKMNELGIPPDVCAWVKIDPQAATVKTKQALREKGDFGLRRRRAVDAKKKSGKDGTTTPQQPSMINAPFRALSAPSAYDPTSSPLPVGQPQLPFERVLSLMHRPADLRTTPATTGRLTACHGSVDC